MNITIKTPEEIKILKEGGKRLAKILASMVEAAKPGVSTLYVDGLAESLIFKSGGKPAFKGYRSKEGLIYDHSICASVNDNIVHGLPRQDILLKEGDILGLDIGMGWGGLFTDTAVTIGVGKIAEDAKKLLHSTKEALQVGIKTVRPGVKVGDIGYAIQQCLEKNKLGVIRELAGHGVGYELHEEPLIPNFGKMGTGLRLKEGMVLAIEPMASLGDWRLKLADDGWTFKTKDGSLAAHFEHTLVVTENGAEVLTKL